ncbi:SigB/SigF/SigG family RNA polymerase sigma factor [Streptomyces sp. 900105245]
MALTGMLTTGSFTSEVREISDVPKATSGGARELSRLLFERLAVLDKCTPEYSKTRNTLIEMNMSLVHSAANRYRTRGLDNEDIIQVGMIGLIKAVDRFDLSRQVQFNTFAVPYIVGEIKRFFRDATWGVHVPRRLQEARVLLGRATDELHARLHRAPTVRELAELLNLPEEEIREARLASNGYNSSSLDAKISNADSGESALEKFIGMEDRALELVEDLSVLALLMTELSERDKEIIYMRFVEELTQAEIGARMGISQMHVSRLLSRVLFRLRDRMITGC